jgi:PAS domain S-box-containing protein
MNGMAGDRGEPACLGRLPIETLAASGVVGLVLWDTSGRIDDANDRFLEMLGYRREDLSNGSLGWADLTPDDLRADHAAALESLKAHGISRGEEKECARRDGTRVFARLHSMLLPEDPDKVLSIVADVSEQKRAAGEQRSLMERTMLAREEAESAVRARDDILGIVSHDLRNPLNIIAMSVALLETSLPEAAQASQLGIIRRAVAGMNRLIGDLLDVSQITSGKLRIDPRPLRVSSICDDVHALSVPLLAAKSQRFECAMPERAIHVLADRERVSQVLSNLIANAHKFTPEGGRIAVKAERIGNEVRFCVEDTGPGVSSQDLPHVFDRFWQARRVRRGGVGLGLPITKGIIDAHGGRIWAESVAGVGSTFHFTLPIAPAD